MQEPPCWNLGTH